MHNLNHISTSTSDLICNPTTFSKQTQTMIECNHLSTQTDERLSSVTQRFNVTCQTDSVNQNEDVWKNQKKTKILTFDSFNQFNEAPFLKQKKLIKNFEAKNENDDDSDSEFIIVPCINGQNSTFNANKNEIYEKIFSEDDEISKKDLTNHDENLIEITNDSKDLIGKNF